MTVPNNFVERIRLVCPALELETLELNQEGLVNDVVIVNGELVFRFPKSDWARQALSREAGVLRVVREHLEMPVPDAELVADDVSRHRLIPGIPLTRDLLLELSSTDRSRELKRLGTFLRSLHSIPVLELPRVQASDAARTRDEWLSFRDTIQTVLSPLLMGYQRQWVERHFAPLESGHLDLHYEPALIHADLAPYHVLFDPDARGITGVIDFGTAGIGDPAIDIACLVYHYGESVVRQLEPSYPLLGRVIDRARFWAGTLELQWALAGLRNDDQSLLVAHIGSARDTQPPGSPIS